MRIYQMLLILPLLLSVSISAAQEPAAIKEYNAGLKYFNLHNYLAASPFFEDAIKKDPTFVNAYKILIRCQEELGQRQLAIQTYQRAIEIAPSDKRLCYNLASAYIGLNDYERAIVYLQKALEIDVAYVKAANKLKEVKDYLARQDAQKYALLVEASEAEDNLEKELYQAALELYRKDKFKEALQKLEDFEEDVTMVDFYYLKAITLQNLGKRDEGIVQYEMALELDDRHFNTNLNLGTIYYNDKNYVEAVKLLETAYARKPNDMPLLYDLGQAQYYAKEYKAAITSLEKYTSHHSKNSEAWLLLGKSYSELDQSKSAASAFDKARQYGGQDDDIANSLQNSIAKYGREASELTQKGNFQGAIDILEQAIEEHSEEASLYFNLGLNYMEVGNYKKARTAFTKAIDMDATHAKAYQALGLIYYEKEEFSTAAAYYQATIDAGKYDEYVYYKLGSCMYKLKRIDQAIEYYYKAIEIQPNIKQFHFGVALAHIAKKENNKSIEALRKALEIDAMYLDAQYHICVNYIEMNQYENCIAEAELLLAKDGLYAKAYLVIAHSYKRMGQYMAAEKYQAKAVELDPTLRD